MGSVLNRLEDFGIDAGIEQHDTVFRNAADFFQLFFYKLAYGYITGCVLKVPFGYVEKTIHKFINHVFLGAYRHVEGTDKRYIQFLTETFY